MSASPLSLIIGVVLGNRGHSVAEHHIGIVERLLHLHGTIWTPANIVVCWTQTVRNVWEAENNNKRWNSTSFRHRSYLAAVGPRCRAWRACSRPSYSSEPHLWQRSNLRLLSWCQSSDSWSDDRRAQRIRWAGHRCWCWDCTRPPCSGAGKKNKRRVDVRIIVVVKRVSMG